MDLRNHKILMVLAGVLAVSVAACADDDVTPPAEPGTIPEVAREAGSFTTLLAAVDAAGLADDLSGAGPFTVFAPTDAAFAALPAGTVDALLADPPALQNVLLYHVFSGELAASGVVSRTSIGMMNGDDAAVAMNGGMATIDGARITMTDIRASNGIIHVIDAVMLPPEDVPPPPGNIAEVATAAGSFTTLLTAARAAGLEDELTGPGPLTVFAPTDAAFAALPAGAVDALLADPAELRDVLLHHVISGELTAAQVVAQDRITTLLGPWLDVDASGASVMLNGVRITATDIEASNGVIHVIDAVMIPPPKLVDLVVSSDDFSTLEAAVGAAGLAETLNGPGPFTVFAPTNAAFAALPAGALDSLLADRAALTNVLTYHVVSGRLPASDVVGRSSLTTLQGSEAAIAVSGSAVTIAGSPVTTTDIQVRNGVVHVISSVMLPPSS